MSALRARREEIARAIERLKSEDQELATAEAVLHRLVSPMSLAKAAASAPAPKAGADKGAKTAPPLPVKGAPHSQRTLVIKLLASCDPPWVRSGDIVQQVKQRWGIEIPERSLRPLLSAMKRERVIERSGRQVALSERI